MKLIKQVTRAGNSANVLLPKEWLGGMARVELIEKPLNIKEDILRILTPYLENILGIYLVGSYARKEETRESDVDVLVITDEVNKKIKNGKYEIILISRNELEKTIKRNAVPLLPMIKEAKTILNKELIEQYKKIKSNEKNLKWIKELTLSSRKICIESIMISKELNENVSDEIMYSLILGLRTVHIIDSLKNNKIPTTKSLIELIEKITNSRESYYAYLRAKNEKKTKSVISTEIAEKLNNYIIEKL
jgi:predicted nucleotidyltransferase